MSLEEEESMESNRFKKLLPLLNHIKEKCFEYYQRMEKSKLRCHMVQFMKDKPTKRGFKLWVVDDLRMQTREHRTS